MATTTEKWIDELKGISVLELSERVKALEEERVPIDMIVGASIGAFAK